MATVLKGMRTPLMWTNDGSVGLVGPGPIVMVDDNDDDAEIVGYYMSKAGLDREFVHVTDGVHLVEFLVARDKEGLAPPALVLLDVNMPRLNGHAALSQVRSHPRFRDLPCVLMLSSSRRPDDRERAAECGATGFLCKPVDPARYQDLFEALAEGPIYGAEPDVVRATAATVHHQQSVA